jgi:hypothetical protein
MRKENCKGEEHNQLPRDPLGGRSSISSHHRTSPAQLHCVKTRNTGNHRRIGRACAPPPPQPYSSTCHNRKFKEQTGLSGQDLSLTNNDTLKVTAVVQQIITELSVAVSDKDKIMIVTKIVLNEIIWLLQFKCRLKS